MSRALQICEKAPRLRAVHLCVFSLWCGLGACSGDIQSGQEGLSSQSSNVGLQSAARVPQPAWGARLTEDFQKSSTLPLLPAQATVGVFAQQDRLYLASSVGRLFQLSRFDAQGVAGWQEVAQVKAVANASFVIPVAVKQSWQVEGKSVQFVESLTQAKNRVAKVELGFAITQARQMFAFNPHEWCGYSPDWTRLECLTRQDQQLHSRTVALPQSEKPPLGGGFVPGEGEVKKVLWLVYPEQLWRFDFYDDLGTKGSKVVSESIPLAAALDTFVQVLLFELSAPQDRQLFALAYDSSSHLWLGGGVKTAIQSNVQLTQQPAAKVAVSSAESASGAQEKPEESSATGKKEAPPSEQPAVAALNFATDIALIARQACADCHNAASAQRGFPFDAELESSWRGISDLIIDSIQAGRMPPSREAFNDDEQAKVLQWLGGNP
ncbi:MAG: hypothetical protein OXT67_13500 [Zetaproteobacteria bacterium]|nr:hypothetical protein [Zetaproteobacteria bacterium]